MNGEEGEDIDDQFIKGKETEGKGENGKTGKEEKIIGEEEREKGKGGKRTVRK